jgi:hypothetical protein
MPHGDLFASAQHPGSRRWAVVEDDGQAAWLYLTGPDSKKPVNSCFLYNRAQSQADSTLVRGDAPVVPGRYLVSGAAQLPPSPSAVHIRWSNDRESVAVLFGGVLMGFLAKGERYGFSKLLAEAGPFGSPLDAALYERTFGAT